MKKIYHPLLKGTNWALAGLMTLVGGAISCGDNDESAPMYGTPHASYTIKGKVVDLNGVAIPDIEVKAGTEDTPKEVMNHPGYRYKTATNTKGEYSLLLNTIGASDFTVYATDIDGEANGVYRPDSVAVAGSKIVLTGKTGAWEDGKGEATVNFSLKEETNKEDH